MKTFRKYSFGSKGAATTKLNALGIDEEGNPTHSHSIVHLGNLVEVAGTYDEEGNELTAPVLSSTYHVDVLWDGEPVEAWDSCYGMVCLLWVFIPSVHLLLLRSGQRPVKHYTQNIFHSQLKKS
jgi:hypothetical protein